MFLSLKYVERIHDDAKGPARRHSEESDKAEGCTKEESVEAGGVNMTFIIPSSLKLEHEEFHAELVKATRAGGRVGDAAKAVAKVLHEHFVKEEEFALPPLGLLSGLRELLLRSVDRLIHPNNETAL